MSAPPHSSSIFMPPALALFVMLHVCGLGHAAGKARPAAKAAGDEAAASAPEAKQTENVFAQKIGPLLERRCFECHSHAHKIKGGLALDSRSGWEKGGESGPAVVPGRPEASLLIQAVSHVEKDLKMPPKLRLPQAEIELLKDWVREGAPDPRSAGADAGAELKTADAWEAEFQKRLDWWSLKPMRHSTPPRVQDAAWAREPVDCFIKAGLEKAGLSPAPPADEATLRRRLALVLTGLPPVAAATGGRGVASAAPSVEQRMEAWVDALLASPRFGEHLARHWMDVVRYTDTYGYEWDNPAKGAYEYRDYLIRAFNDDTGYDQMVREQLAGDLLKQPRIHAAADTNESLIGPMFYHMGEHRHGSSLMFNGIHQEMVNNKIDAFSKAFLATTVACARCHDHKLEAVAQRDYYALAALFTQPRWTTRVVDAPGRNEAAVSRLKELRRGIRKELASLWGGQPPLEAAGLQAWAGTHGEALKGPGPGSALAAAAVVPAEFAKRAAEWRKLNAAAVKARADYTPARLDEWVFEGDGLVHGRTEEGTPLVALEGPGVVARLLPAGWHTHALSSRLPGSLRMPPEHRVPGTHVSLRVAGGEFGGHLVVDDHAFQNETVAFYTNARPEWRTFADAVLKNGAQQVAVEFCTAPLNPNFPPRTGLAKGMKNHDLGYDKRSWISITEIVTHDRAAAPPDAQEVFSGLYGEEGAAAAAPPAEVWARAAAWMNAAVRRWGRNETHSGDCELLDWMLQQGLLRNEAAPGSRLAELVAEYRRVEGGIPFPRSVVSMDERHAPAVKYPLNVRGNVDATGELIAPGSLRMLGAGTRKVADRLALAESLLQPEHPLTARVYVNRVWQWVFGTGLVATPDDFGRLGERPMHPELLDWLAREFIREGWSTKKLVRRLVLSQTFRQSGTSTEAARERDPANRLLSYMPTRRLEAEGIRDALLAVAGRLEPQLYGRPVAPYRTAEDDKKRLFSGPLDGGGRRSVYLQMSIMDPPRFLTGFNLPDLKLPTGRRDVTNVPAQALILLNDPLVHEMAQRWGRQVAERGTAEDIQARVRHMFEQALAREPATVETERWCTALAGLGGDTPEGWAALAHALFNTKEFIYYR
ncbi:PSD1 and planctomycete cytochrome C domain-containing protein [Prosthecobacter vanneervenii]|uniref:Cytochrome c domain-containing protein n=1 Tax=Prosthecobacter vanneervenii TaxID=48466 RepID=A0A7W8DK97_9BACT|nr:PSD1 and planctomycete cytochrome C domain-containing protein [Prosthecobacter vanneervenii]MBB5032646.1 hypothetical protein [Prosthecobacter vanneervenii]